MRSMREPARAVLPAAACFVVAFGLALARVAGGRMRMDEQLFLGGAGLMARGEGLIYRDFFYTHAPTHALLLAGLFRLTEHWATAGRVLDAACGALLATLIFESTRRALQTTPGWRAILAGCVATIFVLNPVTADAFGKAWNHDIAQFGGALGFMLLASGLARARPTWWAVASGACASVAVTSRLTLAPPLVAFPLLIALAPGFDARSRWRLFGWWMLGGVVAGLPAIWVCLQAPAAAWFENVRFPGFIGRYYVSQYSDGRASFGRNVVYLINNIRRSVPLQILIALSAAAVIALRPHRARRSLAQARMASLVVLVLAATATMFAPTTLYHQYLYGPVPFLALLIGWGLAAHGVADRAWARGAIVTLAVACAWGGRADYVGVSLLATPSAWAPAHYHRDGLQLREMIAGRPGKVLTVMPGLALEAGLPIYSGLGIGRYAARSADDLTPEQRQRMNVPDLPTIEGWFAAQPPPPAVLVSLPMSPLEAAMARAAIANGYVEQPFGDELSLFLPPSTEAGNAK